MDGVNLVVSALGITRQKDGLGYREVDFGADMNLLREAETAGVGRVTAGIGALCGMAGLVTIPPPLGELSGAAFGPGAIVRFATVGPVLLRGEQIAVAKVKPA
ncbi:hypothetical protein [Pseudooceanicola aestuarii]|uniref:hypothetical protein n=1 Tax=Pseudooceanicola aestuarii TaxID=2697319 RepID=UPI001EF911F1|nr:hypothetical protein [Pseudooceanicola aestuarii]